MNRWRWPGSEKPRVPEGERAKEMGLSTDKKDVGSESKRKESTEELAARLIAETNKRVADNARELARLAAEKRGFESSLLARKIGVPDAEATAIREALEDEIAEDKLKE